MLSEGLSEEKWNIGKMEYWNFVLRILLGEFFNQNFSSNYTFPSFPYSTIPKHFVSKPFNIKRFLFPINRGSKWQLVFAVIPNLDEVEREESLSLKILQILMRFLLPMNRGSK